MKKLDILKSASGLIVSAGAGAIVGNAIKMTTPADAKIMNKICIGVGGFVLSSMVGDLASKYTADSIDDAAENLKSAMNPQSESI